MRITKITKVAALAGLALIGFAGTSSAATVTCPGTLTTTLTRQVEVSGALTAGYCYYQAGNFTGDNFPAALNPYTLIDKDVASNLEGMNEGGLHYTVDTADRFSGTWSMSSNLWNTYGQIYLAMHFGNGSGNPDSFIVELDPLALSGTWALLPESLANGLSNIYLIGRGSPYCTSPTEPGCGPPPDEVPEPGTLALLGLGLLGLGASRRRG